MPLKITVKIDSYTEESMASTPTTSLVGNISVSAQIIEVKSD